MTASQKTHPSFQSKLSTQDHPRLSEYGALIYPVLSRRSKGVSIGINLNPNKICNFGCVYCQVNRTEDKPYSPVSIEQVLIELRGVLKHVQTNNGYWDGALVKDIAFSGDGEPTTYPHFHTLIDRVIGLLNEFSLPEIKLVVISNASCFHLKNVQVGVRQIYKHGGEVWSKLDVGTSEEYESLMRSKVPFSRVLKNLTILGTEIPLTLQTCLFQKSTESYSPELMSSYIGTVQELIKQGVRIKKIQIYTIAREPAVNYIYAWSNEVMDQIGELLRKELGTSVEVFYKR